MAAMAISSFISLLFLFLTPCLVLSKPQKTYIVHMNHHYKPSFYATHHEWYIAHLESLSTESSTDPSSSLLYAYTTAYHGFAASLDSDQVESLRRSESVFGVYEDSVYSLHTTHTPEFLGLETNLGFPTINRHKDVDEASMDVIIGVLDTGVYPESKSFDDSKMGPIPARWKGECESAEDFSSEMCNKKLIGARSFSKGFRMASGGATLVKDGTSSPRDEDGHGTHTASTAAGSHVANASLLGYARGTARGMAIQARVAAYKVCWKTGCFGSDILAGMDRAILDGVDVLSLSLGGGSGPYYRDTIAIGAFTAVEKGIFVSCSAGNSGPKRASLANVAPWITTVGAGTIDRDFPAFAVVGNGKTFSGVSLYSGVGMGNTPISIVYTKGNSTGNLCLAGSLEPERVRGKIVLCDRGISARVEKGAVVRDAGGIGMILANTEASGEELVADSHLLPAVAVGRKIGDMIRAYVKSDPNPTAKLSFGGTVLNVRPSPIVAAFSSRGPNLVTPQILKPDLIGPGVNILAAWSETVAPTGLANDTRRSKFNIMSGTSMSCPHISGLAALLKAAHPEWSPSAIKSALMTTSYTLDNTKSALLDAATGSVSNPWAHGAGHVDPQKALDPGLVYDITTEEYIAFLCSLDYGLEHVKAIVKRPNVTCSQKLRDPGQLNYPSFAILFGKKRVIRYTRVLTNVGPAESVYDVTVTGPENIQVTVKPAKLVFKTVGQRLRYTVTFVSKKENSGLGGVQFGSLVWTSAKHQVQSQISYEWSQITT
ncbi:hypothetical protein ACHQM5_029361 [Ranunculus cassubicifolius]